MKRSERVSGCLIGGAIGDALGAATEFLDLPTIYDVFGPDGLVDFGSAYGQAVAFTDDTQMTLFTAEGLVWAARDGSDPLDAVWAAYQRWLSTQRGSVPSDASGLAAAPELQHARAPGLTCIGSVEGGTPGRVDQPINDSKGCGGVMRVAPVGLVASSPAQAWDLGCGTAALTHGHPGGWAPSGAMAVMIEALCAGHSLAAAIDSGRAALAKEPQAEEALDWLDRGIALGQRGALDGETIDEFGAGWTGDEALAISVACVLAEPDSNQALLIAVNHSGDSDSTGSIVGQLLGAAHGLGTFRKDWVERIEAAPLLHGVAADLSSLLPNSEPS